MCTWPLLILTEACAVVFPPKLCYFLEDEVFKEVTFVNGYYYRFKSLKKKKNEFNVLFNILREGHMKKYCIVGMTQLRMLIGGELA